MRKLQTIEEMTVGMNEFEKFIFFRLKATELDELKDAWALLLVYGNVSTASIRRCMCVSKALWDSYFEGLQPLPSGFLHQFNQKYSEKLHASRMKKSEQQMEWYFKIGRESSKKYQENKRKNIRGKEFITSPSIAAK